MPLVKSRRGSRSDVGAVEVRGGLGGLSPEMGVLNDPGDGLAVAVRLTRCAKGVNLGGDRSSHDRHEHRSGGKAAE